MAVRLSFGRVSAYLLRGEKGDVLVDTGLPGLGGRLLRRIHLPLADEPPDRDLTQRQPQIAMRA